MVDDWQIVPKLKRGQMPNAPEQTGKFDRKQRQVPVFRLKKFDHFFGRLQPVIFRQSGHPLHRDATALQLGFKGRKNTQRARSPLQRLDDPGL